MSRRFALVAVLFSPLFLGGSAPGIGTPFERAFELTYEVHLDSIPSSAKELRIWIPLAASDDRQKISKRIINVPVPYRVTREKENGNDVLYLDLRNPLPASLDLAVEYEVDVRGQRVLLKAARPGSLSMSRRMGFYLKPSRFMVIDDRIRSLARSVTDGAVTPAQKAERIYNYVIERMSYDKEIPGWGKGDTLRACEVGAGNCTDFHSLFISLARASGIPAQFQIGLPLPDKQEGEIPGYHCWALFYLEGVGWVPVDASEAWKHREKTGYFFGTYDPNRLTVSTGRDIQLRPPPANGPLNIFFFPHVELDGKQVEKEKVKTKFTFKDIAKS